MNDEELNAKKRELEEAVFECETQLEKAKKLLEHFTEKRRKSCSHDFKIDGFSRSERTIRKCEWCGEEK